MTKIHVKPTTPEIAQVSADTAPRSDSGDERALDVALPVIRCGGGGVKAAKTLALEATHMSVIEAETGCLAMAMACTMDTVGQTFSSHFMNDSMSILGSSESEVGSFGDLADFLETIEGLGSDQAVEIKTEPAKLAKREWLKINRMLRNLIREHMREYYKEGVVFAKRGIKGHFTSKDARGKRILPTIDKIGEGISGAMMVKKGGKRVAIVKPVTLPEELLESTRVKEALADILLKAADNYHTCRREFDKFLTEGVTAFFSKQIGAFYKGAAIEKFVWILGKSLGAAVPRVDILKTQGEKTYSVHKYAENKGPLASLSKEELKELDEQSVQDMFVLDALIVNEDRHSHNVLVTEDGKLVLIDHALSLQDAGTKYTTLMHTLAFNGSLRALKHFADRPLTPRTIEKITRFSLRRALAAARSKGLKLDVKIERGLKTRVKRAKKLAKMPGMTVERFMIAVCEKNGYKAIKFRPTVSKQEMHEAREKGLKAFKRRDAASVKIQSVIRRHIARRRAKAAR